ncbi:MAG: S8 family serine peptidase [Flavobacteriaceae bacterium]|jgi:subtilisin family serine protease|nr:S8 family serine peptidase [Flavobacteriaceae bacterium]MBT3918842.1 S8 family serine peptidase [Flavobacteriaceae bacterium]MBT6704271.1 S8 family serine peptidase [Flavobacteriaceae bacterium]MBT7243574.1 S8 family serine peptidase [Flavobacteriaceae bacterium]
MKNLNPFVLAAATTLLLASCGSSVAPINAPLLENSMTLTLKTANIEDAQLKVWSATDLATDTIPGMSVDKAYAELIPNLKGTNVIVAVIDSGIDIEHEDLKNVIWINKGEIPNNGIDDDKNGFIDDVHGWNFLGDIEGENLEFTRIVRRYDVVFNGKDVSEISEVDMETFVLYQKAKAEQTKNYDETKANRDRYTQMLKEVTDANNVISKKLGKEDYTAEDLAAISNPSEEEQKNIAVLTQMLSYGGSIPEFMERLNGGVDYFDGRMKNHFNMDTDFRGVLNDNPYDITDTSYGNNDVDGPNPKKEDALHGTHVAGIIAAQRGNGIGMDGVAQNVEIMVVRAVPDGDEYDKDVALAIRYAVDNGAKVINTSFGKGYSQNPEWVWDAIKYAGKKDVLIVNAAGNDGLDLDITTSYPNDQNGTGAEMSDNFITIGALNYKYGEEMVATFSNYGATSVDLFSPGVKIWSTTPLDTYEYLQGTSMASPNVAGVAAMIRSYYPKLSAKQVKQVLMDSGLHTSTPVIVGGEESNIQPFDAISKSGNTANLYNALIMASKM